MERLATLNTISNCHDKKRWKQEKKYRCVNIQMGLELIKCKYLYVTALIEAQQLITCTTRRHVNRINVCNTLGNASSTDNHLSYLYWYEACVRLKASRSRVGQRTLPNITWIIYMVNFNFSQRLLFTLHKLRRYAAGKSDKIFLNPLKGQDSALTKQIDVKHCWPPWQPVTTAKI